MDGEITGKLEVLGTAKAKASLAISRALALHVEEGDEPFDLKSAKAEVVALTLDGANKSGAFAFDLGETQLSGPSDGRRLDLDLAGASFTASFSPGQPLAITDISLGDRTAKISYDGKLAKTIDVNAQNGRAFNATITGDANGGTTIAVSPKLDLQLFVDHAAAGDFDVPTYDVTRLQLEGSIHGNATSDQIAVTGAFSIATNPASYGFSATTGQCVSGADQTDSNGQLFTQWTVGTCK